MSLESEKEKYLSDLKQNIRNTVKAKVDAMADDKMREKGYIEDEDHGHDPSEDDPSEGPREETPPEDDSQEHEEDEDPSSK